VAEAATAAAARHNRVVCAQCGTELPASLLACPACSTLVHAEQLKRLAAEAEQAESAHDGTRALVLWRQALDLLPPTSKQYASLVDRVTHLAETTNAGARAAEESRVRSRFGKHGAIVSAVAVFLLKFKTVLLIVLTKGKLLLLGLTKLSTLGSMALFLGFDAALFGWQLALGLVLSIYVHEMGHVAALHRHGIKASSPMFLPGLGAFIRAQQRIHGEWAEADVGLAGPLWGLGAAVAAYLGFQLTGASYWATLARWGALINLFNLLPFWQLDGGHAFKAMSRLHRVLAVVAIGAALVLSGERMLWLPLIGAAWMVFRPPARQPDLRALGYYVVLIGSLSALAMWSTMSGSLAR
jgi:Zn-dependent protease